MAIGTYKYSFTSSPEKKKKKGGRHFKGQNKNEKTPTIVARIVPQQRAPVNHLQGNARFCRFCFKKGQQAEECPVLNLKVGLIYLQ